MVAAIQLKNAAPDGTTVMLSIDHTQVTIPLTFKEPGYDPIRDFTPIVGVAQYYNAMAASSKTGVTNLKELAVWLKANPGQANFGIPAAGSIPQFAGLIGRAVAGREDGADPLQGRRAAGAGHHRRASADRLRLAHRVDRAPPRRAPAPAGGLGHAARALGAGYPDLPGTRPQGHRQESLAGVFGPAGLPPNFVNAFTVAVRVAMDSPEAKERFAALGVEPTLAPQTNCAAGSATRSRTGAR